MAINILWEVEKFPVLKVGVRISLMVQWLRLRASNAGGAGSIPGLETKPSSCVAWPKKLKDNKYLLFLMICLSSNYAVVKMLTFPSKGKEKKSLF